MVDNLKPLEQKLLPERLRNSSWFLSHQPPSLDERACQEKNEELAASFWGALAPWLWFGLSVLVPGLACLWAPVGLALGGLLVLLGALGWVFFWPIPSLTKRPKELVVNLKTAGVLTPEDRVKIYRFWAAIVSGYRNDRDQKLLEIAQEEQKIARQKYDASLRSSLIKMVSGSDRPSSYHQEIVLNIDPVTKEQLEQPIHVRQTLIRLERDLRDESPYNNIPSREQRVQRKQEELAHIEYELLHWLKAEPELEEDDFRKDAESGNQEQLARALAKYEAQQVGRS